MKKIKYTRLCLRLLCLALCLLLAALTGCVGQTSAKYTKTVSIDGFDVTLIPKYVGFGSYPQTQVAQDSAEYTFLHSRVPGNTIENNKPSIGEETHDYKFSYNTYSQTYTWYSMGYYSEGEITHYAWYCDLEVTEELVEVLNRTTEGFGDYIGNKYRLVYIYGFYRPTDTQLKYGTSGDNSYVDDNGYFCYGDGNHNSNGFYWFRFEPIEWQILQLNDDGSALLFSRDILDSQHFYNVEDIVEKNTTGSSPDSTDKPNDYGKSNIRTWLNSTFYNAAFSTDEKKLIKTTEVDNSYLYSGNSSTYANTEDNVFLLSYHELKNANYRLADDIEGVITLKEKKTSSDYAKAQGLYPTTSRWLLRTATTTAEMSDMREANNKANEVLGETGSNFYWYWKNAHTTYVSDTTVETNGEVTGTYFGVCPAIWVSNLFK